MAPFAQIPVWPFVLLSYAAGAFALLPFMALWSPIKGYKLPLPKEELVSSVILASLFFPTVVLTTSDT